MPDEFLNQRVLAYCVPNNTLNCVRLSTDSMLFNCITPLLSMVINHTTYKAGSRSVVLLKVNVRFSMLVIPSMPEGLAAKKSVSGTPLI